MPHKLTITSFIPDMQPTRVVDVGESVVFEVTNRSQMDPKAFKQLVLQLLGDRAPALLDGEHVVLSEAAAINLGAAALAVEMTIARGR